MLSVVFLWQRQPECSPMLTGSADMCRNRAGAEQCSQQWTYYGNVTSGPIRQAMFCQHHRVIGFVSPEFLYEDAARYGCHVGESGDPFNSC